MTAGRRLRGAAGVAIFLLLAELATRTGLVGLPPASRVLAGVPGVVSDPEFLADVLATMLAWALGLALAVAVAVPAGLLLGVVAPVEWAFRPVIEFLRPIPSVALIPLVLLVFADDLRTKVAIIVYACSWPLLINTMYGVRDVDPLAKETLRAFGFGRAAVLRLVSLPSAAPFIATGVRLSASIALVLAISAELLAGGSNGIGVYTIRTGTAADHVTPTLAAVLLTGLIGLLVNTVLVRLERRLFHWREEPA
ncbi:ABC transporter permease subunit [Nonomuraea sp. NN258]|uniref:ABC transporter permease n=1 Tax=Nonomuraea antri TaxID=2730852 RepID=UPI00156A2AE2|nr:ABC transporter permease subunit [Nonomuraea antri]NRQ35009.1 ABC transporter permease subunit [Nonomuraea antri]